VQDKIKMVKQKQVGNEHIASAKMTNLPISTKHSIEISHYLRYKDTAFAKKFLEEVILLKKPVPFKRFIRDTGHKKGMSAGRYPQKAAKSFLRVIKSVEANAQDKGLSTSNLKIVKLVSNKAAIPMTGGRSRSGTKRTHLEIQVKEGKERKKETKKKEGARKEVLKKQLKKVELVQAKVEEKVAKVKSEKKETEKNIEEKTESPKGEIKPETALVNSVESISEKKEKITNPEKITKQEETQK
jgi:large subunit ribosomal protein L22